MSAFFLFLFLALALRDPCLHNFLDECSWHRFIQTKVNGSFGGGEVLEFVLELFGIPAFKHKKVLVWFAAFSEHCSLFPTASVIVQCRSVATWHELLGRDRAWFDVYTNNHTLVVSEIDSITMSAPRPE